MSVDMRHRHIKHLLQRRGIDQLIEKAGQSELEKGETSSHHLVHSDLATALKKKKKKKKSYLRGSGLLHTTLRHIKKRKRNSSGGKCTMA